jgi:hypothetical protein
MKKLFTVGLCLAALAAIAADRVTTVTEASVRVYKVELELLPDAGCSVVAHARITQTDGGTLTEASRGGTPVEVAGTNRTDCLNIINTRAPVLFKSTNGF